MKRAKGAVFILLLNVLETWAQKYPKYLGSIGGIPMYAPYEQPKQAPSGNVGGSAGDFDFFRTRNSNQVSGGVQQAPNINTTFIDQTMKGNNLISKTNIVANMRPGANNVVAKGKYPIQQPDINTVNLVNGFTGTMVDPTTQFESLSAASYPNGIFLDVHKQIIGPVQDFTNSGTTNIHDPLSGASQNPSSVAFGPSEQQPTGISGVSQAIDIHMNGEGASINNQELLVDITKSNSGLQPTIRSLNSITEGTTDGQIMSQTGDQIQSTNGVNFIGQLRRRSEVPTAHQNPWSNFAARNTRVNLLDPAIMSSLGIKQPVIVIPIGLDQPQTPQIIASNQRHWSTVVDPVVEPIVEPIQGPDPSQGEAMSINQNAFLTDREAMIVPSSGTTGLTDQIAFEPAMDTNIGNIAMIDPVAMADQNAFDPAIIDPNMGNTAMAGPTAFDPAIIDPNMRNTAMAGPTAFDPAIIDPNMGNTAMAGPTALRTAITDQITEDTALIDPIDTDPVIWGQSTGFELSNIIDPGLDGPAYPKYRSKIYSGVDYSYRKPQKLKIESYGKGYFKSKYGKIDKNHRSYGKSYARYRSSLYNLPLSYGKPRKTYHKSKTYVKHYGRSYGYGMPKIYNRVYRYGNQKSYHRPRYGIRFYRKPNRFYGRKGRPYMHLYRKGGY